MLQMFDCMKKQCTCSNFNFYSRSRVCCIPIPIEQRLEGKEVARVYGIVLNALASNVKIANGKWQTENVVVRVFVARY